LNTEERSDIISSWRRATVEHALAKANKVTLIRAHLKERQGGQYESGVLRSHGRPNTIGAEGWSFMKEERGSESNISKGD